MIIFVLTGTSGEYSEREEWLVRAYKNEKEAEQKVIELTQKIRKWEILHPYNFEKGGFGKDGQRFPKFLKKEDPGAIENYVFGDTTYFLQMVELV